MPSPGLAAPVQCCPQCACSAAPNTCNSRCRLTQECEVASNISWVALQRGGTSCQCCRCVTLECASSWQSLAKACWHVESTCLPRATVGPCAHTVATPLLLCAVLGKGSTLNQNASHTAPVATLPLPSVHWQPCKTSPWLLQMPQPCRTRHSMHRYMRQRLPCQSRGRTHFHLPGRQHIQQCDWRM